MPTQNSLPPTLLHVFSTFDVGGPQIRFITLARRLGARYRHVVIASDNRYGAASLVSDCPSVQCWTEPLDKRLTLGNLRRYRLLIRSSGAARLITYNWGATPWALANLIGGVPHVHVEDGFGPDESKRQFPRRVWFRRLALARARPIVVPSRTLERIALDVWRFSPSKLAYIPNGVDCDRFRGAPDPALLAKLGLAPDPSIPIVGTVAGLRAEKNLARLLRAFALVVKRRPARLVIVGDGIERAALERLAGELGIAAATVFAGQLAQVERILGAFSVYALSSDTEQMPLSLIEAMAARLPVAAVDVGDVAQMVAEKNQSFITPIDDVKLADAVLALLADQPLAAAVGAANATKARREFDETAMVAAYDALYAGNSHRPV